MNARTITLPAGMRAAHRRTVMDTLRQIAGSIEAELQIEAGDAAASRRRHQQAKACRQACKGIAEAIARGTPEAEALAAAAHRLGLDPAQLGAHWEIARRLLKAHSIGLRNRKIMRLAAHGWTDAQIGRKFRLHPNSVNRIISRQLARKPAPARKPPLALVARDNAPAPLQAAAPPAPWSPFQFTRISSSPPAPAPVPTGEALEGERRARPLSEESAA